MDHPYEKIFLSGIGEEFDVSFPAMMADHSKTCDLIGSIGICIYLDTVSYTHLDLYKRQVLEDAGVYKRTEEGKAAFKRFIESL